MLHIELYAGKDFPIHSDMGQAHGVVMDLMQKVNLLNKDYHLLTDNFYTKPVLATTHMQAGILLTGTVKQKPKCIAVYNMYMGELISAITRFIKCLPNAPRSGIGRRFSSTCWTWLCSTASSSTTPTLMSRNV